MSLLLDVFDITGALLRYEVAQCKRQLNRGINGCALLTTGLAVLLVSMVLLLRGLYLLCLQTLGPASAAFITAAGALAVTGALILAAFKTLQHR
jgi:hypothetical protein